MRELAFGTVFATISALSLTGCVPTPGAADYAAAARAHQEQAREHGYLAERNREAARWQASYGDARGAARSEAAATDQTQAAQWERFQATKDRWLSW
jgi:hypothetical protein